MRVSRKFEEGSPGGAPLGSGRKEGWEQSRSGSPLFSSVSSCRLISPARWAQATESPAVRWLLGSGFALRRSWGDRTHSCSPRGPVINCCQQENLGVNVTEIFLRRIFNPYCFTGYSLRSVHPQLLFESVSMVCGFPDRYSYIFYLLQNALHLNIYRVQIELLDDYGCFALKYF